MNNIIIFHTKEILFINNPRDNQIRKKDMGREGRQVWKKRDLRKKEGISWIYGFDGLQF